MGKTSTVTNGKSSTEYTVSTVLKHNSKYYLEALCMKISITIQTRIKSKNYYQGKKQTVYINWFGEDATLADFHEKMVYLVTVANDENLGDFILERLNEESNACAFEDKVMFRNKTRAIFVR